MCLESLLKLWTEVDKEERVLKNELIKNKPEEVKRSNAYIKVKKWLIHFDYKRHKNSYSWISWLGRLQQKLKFQNWGHKGKNTLKIGEFLVLITLKRFGYWRRNGEFWYQLSSYTITHGKSSQARKIKEDSNNSLSRTMLRPPNKNVDILPIKMWVIDT